ncbi:MAG: orotate phosphoribosyltransferase [Patescibacteria group bacterium]
MNKTSEEIAEILLSIGAVSLNVKKPFRYSSGILSPVYTDCRLIMSYPKERKIVINLLAKAISSYGSFDVIAGTATAGIPHVAWIAGKLNLPMIYVRNKSKDHGKENLIEGVLKKRQKVVVVEDLISTAQSSVFTINAARSVGAIANVIFAITTYNLLKSKEVLKENKVKLISLTNLSDLSSIALKNKHITVREHGMILQWAKDPSSWGKRMGFE